MSSSLHHQITRHPTQILNTLRQREHVPSFHKLVFVFTTLSLSIVSSSISRGDYVELYKIYLPILLILRFIVYRSQRWQFFMLDFCYVTNYVTLFALYFFSPSTEIRTTLLSISFAWSNGPVAVAIWGWRNSIVYHSLDKFTTFAIHMSPIVVSWCLREEFSEWSCVSVCSFGLLGYLSWQFFYLFMTEFVFKKKLKREVDLLTSLRWIARDTRGGMHVITKTCAVRLGFLSPDDKISPEDRHIKMIFVVAQFLYTCLCMIIVPVIFVSRIVHGVWIVFVFGIAAWNGAGFYFSVFKRGDYDKAVREGRMGLYAIATAPPRRDEVVDSSSSGGGVSSSSSSNGNGVKKKK